MQEVNGMFQFTFENPSEVVPIINSWLSLNAFTLKSDKNGKFFQGGSSLTYVKFLEYYVSEKSILVNPYIGSRKKPRQLDDNIWGSAYKQAYRNELQSLFTQLDQLSRQQDTMSQFNGTYNMPQDVYGQGNGYANLNGNPYNTGSTGYASPQPQMSNPGYTASNYNQAIRNIKEEHDNQLEKGVMVAFVVSIAGLFLPLIGFYMGWLICIYTYAYAVKGLNTSKKGFAIATLVFSTLDMIFFVLCLLSNFNIL